MRVLQNLAGLHFVALRGAAGWGDLERDVGGEAGRFQVGYGRQTKFFALKTKGENAFRRFSVRRKTRNLDLISGGDAIAGCACDEVVRLPEGEARAAKRSQEAARFRSDSRPRNFNCARPEFAPCHLSIT